MNRGEQRSIKLQPRDIELLRGLFESRVMTLAHVAALHFDGRGEAAKKRVQKLKSAGLIRERPRHVNEPSVLFLTRQAFRHLSDHGYLSDYPQIGLANLEKRAQVSDLTIRHELEVADVKAAMVKAIRNTSTLEVAEFSTWPALHEFRAQRSDGEIVTVKPDGFIRIHEREDGVLSEHMFFLEVDRSTETIETLAIKAHCYRDYYRRGGIAIKEGRPASEFEHFPFRVLMILVSEERRHNVARRMLQLSPPIFTQVWLNTLHNFLDEPLGPLWLRPVDYREEFLGGAQMPRHASKLLSD